MAWIGLHTGPNIDPHATLAWWRDENLRPAVALHRAKHIARTVQRTQVWVARHEMYGIRNDIEVAILMPNGHVQYAVDVCKDLHESDWAIKPHVTAHNERQCFTLAWVGLHFPDEHRYWKLRME